MAGIKPIRGTYTNKTVTLTNTPGYAVINLGDASLYIKNSASDANADSTEVPAGGSFSSFNNFPYFQAGYAQVVIVGTSTTFSIEALPGAEPTVV